MARGASFFRRLAFKAVSPGADGRLAEAGRPIASLGLRLDRAAALASCRAGESDALGSLAWLASAAWATGPADLGAGLKTAPASPRRIPKSEAFSPSARFAAAVWASVPADPKTRLASAPASRLGDPRSEASSPLVKTSIAAKAIAPENPKTDLASAPASRRRTLKSEALSPLEKIAKAALAMAPADLEPGSKTGLAPRRVQKARALCSLAAVAAAVQILAPAALDTGQAAAQGAAQAPAAEESPAPGQASGQGAQSGEAQPGPVGESEKSRGFREAMDQVFPMTPEMIREYRQTYEEQQKAMLERKEPEAQTDTALVSLDPGEPAPEFRVAPGIASVISFYDAAGKPWPITQYIIGNAEGFQVIQLGASSNSLAVTPGIQVGWTNLIAVLQGEDRPAIAQVKVSPEAVHLRRDLQIMRRGPNSPMDGFPQNSPMEAGSPLLLTALQGSGLPASASSLEVMGVKGKAWKIGESVYVRTPGGMASPAWTSAISGPGGMNVYAFPESMGNAVFMVDGKPAEAAFMEGAEK